MNVKRHPAQELFRSEKGRLGPGILSAAAIAFLVFFALAASGLPGSQEDASIEVLNPQSHPTVGGTWTVRFNTTGTADLTVTPVNGTTWKGTNSDLDFLDIRCNGEAVFNELEGGSVLVQNYSCKGTGSLTSRVITGGKHYLELDFGGEVARAENYAGNPTFQNYTVYDNANSSRSVHAADIGGDGDMDVLSSSQVDNSVRWYENNGSESFTNHTVCSNAGSARSVHAADIGGDGDSDYCSGSTWYDCNGDDDCDTGNGYHCSGNDCTLSCSQNSDCPSGYYCSESATCTAKKSSGAPCDWEETETDSSSESNGVCSSGYCRDDYDNSNMDSACDQGEDCFCAGSSTQCVHNGGTCNDGNTAPDCHDISTEILCGSGDWDYNSCFQDSCPDGGFIVDVSNICVTNGENNCSVDVRVTDKAGNSNTDSAGFDIDAVPPEPTVSVNTDPIWDGDLTQNLTVTYDEVMNTSGSDPIIFFDNDAGDWTSNGDGHWSSTNRSWIESFSVQDNDSYEEIVSVTGAYDLAGNGGGSDTTYFYVDTQNPDISFVPPTPNRSAYVGGEVQLKVNLLDNNSLKNATIYIDTPSGLNKNCYFNGGGTK